MGVGMAVDDFPYKLFGTHVDAGGVVDVHASTSQWSVIGFSTAFNKLASAGTREGNASAWWTHRHWYVEQPRSLAVGGRAWTSKEGLFGSVPNEMRGCGGVVLVWGWRGSRGRQKT